MTPRVEANASRRSSLPISASAFVVLGCGLLAIVRLYQAFRWAVSPYEIDYAEGTIVVGALRLLHGQALYPPPDQIPYILSPYAPGGYGIGALALKVFGVSLVGPRALTMCAAVLCAALIATMTWSLTRRWTAGCVLGAAFLCSPLVWIWLPVFRVDLFAVAAALAGVLLFIHDAPSPVVALAFVVAVFTKQTAVAAPLACAAVALIDRQYSRLASLGVWALTQGAAAWTLLGGDALFHLVTIHAGEASLALYATNLRSGLSGSMAAVLAIAAGVTGSRGEQRARLPWCYFGACSVTSLTAATIGADTNHFLEWAAAASWLGAVLLSPRPDSAPAQRAPGLLWGIVAMTLAAVVNVRWMPARAVDPDQCEEAYRFIATFPGQKILAEDVWSVLVAGREIQVSDPFAYTRIALSRWSDGGVERRVEEGYFDLVVLGEDRVRERWSPLFLQSVSKAYKPVRSFRCSGTLRVAYMPVARN